MTTETARPGEPSLARPTDVPGRLAAEHALRVLVVDDDQDIAGALRLILETCGHQVEAVHRAAQVAVAVERFTPQRVLLDIGLPDRSGYEVAADLLALERRDRMRVIALSGSDDDPRTDQALFDHWLTKPVSTQELLQALAGR